MAPPEDETLPSGSLLGTTSDSTLGFNTTRTTYHMKDIEPPSNQINSNLHATTTTIDGRLASSGGPT